MNIENVSQVCHEVNKSYCEAIGDMNQVPWSDAPEWQKESALKGVYLHMTNPGATPEDSHNAWLKEKQDTGWKYGPVKDVELKEHPCYRPYKELPPIHLPLASKPLV